MPTSALALLLLTPFVLIFGHAFGTNGTARARTGTAITALPTIPRQTPPM